jgi:hypothetical protein
LRDVLVVEDVEGLRDDIEVSALPEYQILEPLGFAVLIFSLGYIVAERIFSDGHRLVAIENELAIA